jgi:hypothetical protein
VTLTRLLLAWLPVAAWFTIVTYATPSLVGPLAQRLEASLLKWRVVEAGVLTLFASLWFDSLGRGGWWLLFLLVGALATIPRWLPEHGREVPPRVLLIGACVDLARYEIAGVLLAWRLG